MIFSTLRLAFVTASFILSAAAHRPEVYFSLQGDYTTSFLFYHFYLFYFIIFYVSFGSFIFYLSFISVRMSSQSEGPQIGGDVKWYH